MCLPLFLFGQADPAIQAEFAKQAMAAGRHEEAVRLYSDLAKRFPRDAGTLANLGMAQSMAGQHEAAVATLRGTLKLDARLMPAYLFLGGSLMETGRQQQAIAPLETFLKADPQHAHARLMLADALLATARFERAAAEYQRLTELDHTRTRFWQGLGRAQEGVAREAIAQLEKLLPGSAWGFALAGETRLQQRQFSSAYYLLRQALDRNPNIAGLHAAIAQIYRETAHPDWATQEEAEESRIRPARPHPLYVKARNAQKAATEAYTRLVQLPPSVDIHTFLAETYRLQKRHVEEAEQWEAALQFDPGNRNLLTELAIAKHYARDDAAAQAIVEKLLSGDPNSAQLNFMLGDTLLAQQKADAAIEHLRKSVELDPNMLAGHSSLARAYLAAGQGEAAIPHLLRALPIDRDGSLHFQLARAYQSAGKGDLAKQTLAKYQAIRKRLDAEKQVLEEEMKITPPSGVK